MKIKNYIRLLLLLSVILLRSVLFAQTNVIHFNYDNSGNRTDRSIEVVLLKKQNSTIKNDTLNTQDLSTLTKDSVNQIAPSTDDKFNVFPNPVNEILNIQYTSENSILEYSFQIFDESGRLFYSGKLTQNKNEVNLGKAKSGIYYLVVTSTNGENRFFWKLIKK